MEPNVARSEETSLFLFVCCVWLFSFAEFKACLNIVNTEKKKDTNK